MMGTAEMARRELAALGDALFQAERGVGHQSPAALAARLLRVAALHPAAVDHTLMWQVTDLVAGRDIADSFKLVVIRMGWASIVRAEFRTWGLQIIGNQGASRAKAA